MKVDPGSGRRAVKLRRASSEDRRESDSTLTGAAAATQLVSGGDEVSTISVSLAVAA